MLFLLTNDFTLTSIFHFWIQMIEKPTYPHHEGNPIKFYLFFFEKIWRFSIIMCWRQNKEFEIKTKTRFEFSVMENLCKCKVASEERKYIKFWLYSWKFEKTFRTENSLAVTPFHPLVHFAFSIVVLLYCDTSFINFIPSFFNNNVCMYVSVYVIYCYLSWRHAMCWFVLMLYSCMTVIKLQKETYFYA